MARSGGEAEETIYGGDLAENVAVVAEPHLLAPEAYDGCAGLTSKEIGGRNVELAIHQASAVGKKHIETEHEAGRGKDLHDTTNISDNEVHSKYSQSKCSRDLYDTTKNEVHTQAYSAWLCLLLTGLQRLVQWGGGADIEADLPPGLAH